VVLLRRQPGGRLGDSRPFRKYKEIASYFKTLTVFIYLLPMPILDNIPKNFEKIVGQRNCLKNVL
jgi:hypothetical protein